MPLRKLIVVRETTARVRVVLLVLGTGSLLCPCQGLAQRGGGAPIGAGSTPGFSRPGGVSEKDELKNFHEAMAVQATSKQAAEFRAIVTNTEAAARELDALTKSSESAGHASDLSAHATALRQALEKARSGTKDFLAGFSPAQKSGLKETSARLIKAESDLAEQEKSVDWNAPDATEQATRIAGRSEAFRRALANFRNQQNVLGSQLGIVQSAEEQRVAFDIPPNKTTVNIAGQPIAITTSAVIVRAPGNAGDNVFRVEATTGLAELRDNLASVLGAQLDRQESCGERVRVSDATLSPAIPSSLAVIRLHYERWFCSRAGGVGSSREMAEGNATVEIQLTPSVGADGQLQMAAEITRVEAERFLDDLLHSDTLGSDLREKVSRSVLAGIVNLKAALPPAVAGEAKVQSVQFASAREDDLTVVVSGEMKISAEQTQLLAAQLKERLASRAGNASAPPVQSR
ncbi:MAG: hypothetical protein ABSG70_08455 [Terriglobales bacterium]|jgi:hypothetical protein